MFKHKSLGMLAGLVMAIGLAVPAFAADKVEVCHLSANGEYELIEVAQSAWDNAHSDHEGDFLFSVSLYDSGEAQAAS